MVMPKGCCGDLGEISGDFYQITYQIYQYKLSRDRVGLFRHIYGAVILFKSSFLMKSFHLYSCQLCIRIFKE